MRLFRFPNAAICPITRRSFAAAINVPKRSTQARETPLVQPTCTQFKSSLTLTYGPGTQTNKYLTALTPWEKLVVSLPRREIVMSWLRLSLWSSAILAIVFQAAFMFELHSPQAVDVTLWSLFTVSLVCVIVFVFARNALSSLKKFRN